MGGRSTLFHISLLSIVSLGAFLCQYFLFLCLHLSFTKAVHFVPAPAWGCLPLIMLWQCYRFINALSFLCKITAEPLWAKLGTVDPKLPVAFERFTVTLVLSPVEWVGNSIAWLNENTMNPWRNLSIPLMLNSDSLHQLKRYQQAWR